MTDDWKLDYSYDGVDITPDWKLDEMEIEFMPKIILNDSGEFEKIQKEPIKIKFEIANCSDCKTETKQIILSDTSNYKIDKTISRTQKIRCDCGKVKERIIYGCDKCEKCTVQVFVKEYRNKEPETVKEAQWFSKRFLCEICDTLNWIEPDILDDNNSDQKFGMKDLF